MTGFVSWPYVTSDAEDFCNRRRGRPESKDIQDLCHLGVDSCVTVPREDNQTMYLLFELGQPVWHKCRSCSRATVAKGLCIGLLSAKEGCVNQVFVADPKLKR